MTANNFKRCLEDVLFEEGGLSNNPRDPGGLTNHGVTQATYDKYRKVKGLFRQSVALIAQIEISDIYWSMYWMPAHCFALPSGIDLMIFDWSVNSGPVAALKGLQRVCGERPTGAWDLYLQNHVKVIDLRRQEYIKLLSAQRLGFMRSLSVWRFFGRNWTTRVNRITDKSIAMTPLP
jgi:lysozyme family protein